MEYLLQRYKDYLCGEHSNHNTITNKFDTIRTLLRHTQGTISQDTIQQFKIWMNQHYSHNSRNNKINAINQFLRWDGHPELQMKHIGFIETNQYALTEKQIDMILTATQKNPLENLIVICLFDGALRPSEIIDIRIDRRDGNRLYLDDTKTGDKRIILSPVLIHAWDTYLKIRPQPKPGHEQYLILKDRYKEKGMKYVDTHPINDMLRNITRLAGIQDVTPYTIRRTSATLRLNKYSKYYMGDPKLVQTLFRHADFSTTMRYDRTSDLDIERYFDEQSTINTRESTINKAASTINTKESTQNLMYGSPQELNIYNEGDDNSSVSFSYSFSFIEFLNDGRGGTTIDNQLRDWLVSGLSPGRTLKPHAQEVRKSLRTYNIHTPDLIQTQAFFVYDEIIDDKVVIGSGISEQHRLGWSKPRIFNEVLP
ncbi:MAG TPA: site-specific integrase [Candidatus Thermoplasmatota archaeon]|nr:site-specific integrase [Candidatus Thermoplasmatota archaeon]